jgi:hypothetical protein
MASSISAKPASWSAMSSFPTSSMRGGCADHMVWPECG